LLSIAYIVKNEAKNIIRSLESVKGADEIIIVDTGSTDDTIKVIEESGIPVKLFVKQWTNFADCRNFAMDKCTGDYILILDADETVRDFANLDKLINDKSVDVWSVIQLDNAGQMCYTYRLVKSDCRYKSSESQDVIHEAIDTTGKVIAYSDLIIDHHKELTEKEHRAKIESIMSVFDNIPDGLKKDYYEGVYFLWNGQHTVGFEKLNRCIDKVSPQLQAFIYLMVGHYYNILQQAYSVEALYFYDKSLKLAPEQNEGYIKLAEYYLSRGDKNTALEYLHKLRDRKNRLKTEMQNDKYYTTEQIDFRINQLTN
jgi:glycosyltransferase involved in cell wall biosynthesis